MTNVERVDTNEKGCEIKHYPQRQVGGIACRVVSISDLRYKTASALTALPLPSPRSFTHGIHYSSPQHRSGAAL